MTLDRLSALFVALRAAVVDRAGLTRPGIDAALAARALDLVERFRVWADHAPLLVPDHVWRGWEGDYTRMRAELGTAGAALAEVDPPSELERALGSVTFAAAAVGVLYLLTILRRR